MSIFDEYDDEDFWRPEEEGDYDPFPDVDDHEDDIHYKFNPENI